MKIRWISLFRSSLINIVVILSLSGFLYVPVMGQTCSQSAWIQVQKVYEQGYFSRTLANMKQNGCLPNLIEDTSDRKLAYELIAVSHLIEDRPDSANVWVKQMIKEYPRYQSVNPLHPVKYEQMVSKEKRRWFLFGWIFAGTKWYHWVGRGVIGTGVGFGVWKAFFEKGPGVISSPPDFPPNPSM